MNRVYSLCAAALICWAPTAHAEIDEIFSPLVTKHELELEYEGSRLSDSGKSLNNAQHHEIEARYGVTDNLLLGILGEGDRSSGTPFRGEGVGAQAVYTTTKQGAWWLNSAIFAQYTAATHNHTADSAEARVLLSRAQGPVTVTANLIFGREIGPNRSHGVGFGNSVQGLYDIHNEHFTPGVEWFADYGKLNHFNTSSDQQHYLGPVATGEIASFGQSEIEYTVGYYWGLTNASADNGARLELEYNLHF